MKKSDIEYHSIGNGYQRAPVVNVKVNFRRDRDMATFRKANPETDERFTWEWIDEHEPDDDGTWFGMACEHGWEGLQTDAEDIYGSSTKVHSTGRSGGYAYIECFVDRGDGNPVDAWDAVALSKWAKFCKWARQQADDVPYLFLDSIYFNAFLPWAEAEGRTVEFDCGLVAAECAD